MEKEDALTEALRLAIDPPGTVSVEALRELARDDDANEWDIATTAEHLGLNPHTLRYYERIGLVQVARDSAGHRVYDAASVRRLVFLTRMRVSGVDQRPAPLRRADRVRRGDRARTARMLLEHRDTLRAQIAQLQLSLAATEYKIATYQEGPLP